MHGSLTCLSGAANGQNMDDTCMCSEMQSLTSKEGQNTKKSNGAYLC